MKADASIMVNSSIKRTPANSWEASFPGTAETDTESLLFIKRLTFVAVSHILKLRGVLPVDSFKKRKLDGLYFHVLGSSTRLSSKATDIVKGACGAIDKKYLRELMLIIGDDRQNLEKALEVFILSYTYSHDKGNALQITDADGKPMGPPLKYNGMQAMRRQTALLIQRLIALIATLEPLPAGCFSSLKLNYYDRTPVEYEPVCFSAFHGAVPYVFSKEHVPSLLLGRVNTRYHCLQVRVESIFIEDTTECEERLVEHEENMKEQSSLNSLSPQSVWNMDTPKKVDGGKRRRLALNESVTMDDPTPTAALSSGITAAEVRAMKVTETTSAEKENHQEAIADFKTPKSHAIEHETFDDLFSPYKTTTVRDGRRVTFVKNPVRLNDQLENMMAPLATSTPIDPVEKDKNDKLHLITSLFDKTKISEVNKTPLTPKNNRKKSKSRPIVKSQSPVGIVTPSMNIIEMVPDKNNSPPKKNRTPRKKRGRPSKKAT